MSVTNKMELKFESRSENEGFARVAVAAFFSQMNPTLDEVEDVRTAVSEAVTNAIIHGYEKGNGMIVIRAHISKDIFSLEVEDWGVGISNIAQAMEPLFTTKSEEERSGLGFVFMQSFMDQVTVESELGKGTLVKMTKKLRKKEELWTTQSL